MVVLKVNRQADLSAPHTFSWSLCWQVRKPWLICMLLILASFWTMEFSDMVLGLLFSALLVLLALLDCRYLLIYDKLVLALLVLGSLPLLLGRTSWEDACLGAALGGGFLGALRLLTPRGMGWGDIKLAIALGMWLGTAGMLVCLYAAFLSGGLYGAYIWLRKGSGRNVRIPFGPFLALGAVTAFVLGDRCEGVVEAWLCYP